MSAKHDVQATFFVTGMAAERFPQPIAEISQTAEGDGDKAAGLQGAQFQAGRRKPLLSLNVRFDLRYDTGDKALSRLDGTISNLLARKTRFVTSREVALYRVARSPDRNGGHGSLTLTPGSPKLDFFRYQDLS